MTSGIIQVYGNNVLAVSLSQTRPVTNWKAVASPSMALSTHLGRWNCVSRTSGQILNTSPRFDDAYITWINDGTPSWTIVARGMGLDTLAEIGPRPIPQEPMVCRINRLNACLVSLTFHSTSSPTWVSL